MTKAHLAHFMAKNSLILQAFIKIADPKQHITYPVQKLRNP